MRTRSSKEFSAEAEAAKKEEDQAPIEGEKADADSPIVEEPESSQPVITLE